MEAFTYLWKSAAILSIFYMVYLIFLRKDTLFVAKRHYFMGGMLLSLILPFIEFTKVIYTEVPKTILSNSPRMDGIPSEIITATTNENPMNWWQLALGLYALGMLFLLARLIIQLFSLLKLIHSYPSEKRGNYLFVRVPEAIAPFSFFRYIVYNPKLHAEEELQMILKHEKVHASQWHSLDIILANSIRILQWGNPFSWFYKKSLEENLEFIADNETAAQVASLKEYQLTLVKASSPLIAPALTTQFYQSFIKKRIIMLNKQHSKKRNAFKAMIILPFLAFFLWSFNVKEVITYTEIEKEEIPSEKDMAIKLANHTSETETVSSTEVAAVTLEEKDKTFPTSEEKETKTQASVQAPVLDSPTIFTTEFRINITKNTTDAELLKMKTELKEEHGIDLSYTTVRNSNSEIISINLSYSGKGSSGSYSINDDNPIEPFYFYMKDDGESGFYSEGMEKRHAERLARRMEQMEERNHEREARLAQRMEEREERHEDMEEEREERHEDMEERREKMHKRLEKQRVKMHKQHEKMKERQQEMEEHHSQLARVHSNTSHSSGNRTYQHTGDSGEHIIIGRNTTDAELEKIKSALAAKDITFNYKRVKRNSQGEIIGIKIDVDNGKGSKTQTSIRADANDPIDEIVIEI